MLCVFFLSHSILSPLDLLNFFSIGFRLITFNFIASGLHLMDQQKERVRARARAQSNHVNRKKRTKIQIFKYIEKILIRMIRNRTLSKRRKLCKFSECAYGCALSCYRFVCSLCGRM